MKRIFFVSLIVALTLVSCSKDDGYSSPDPVDQTVLMYLPWSGDLTRYFENNIKDLEKAIANGILGEEKALVYFNTSATEATLFELQYSKGKVTRKVHKTYQDHPFTTAGGITSILDDVKMYAPARRYAMTIGCHGLGWIPVSQPLSRGAEEKGHWEYEGPVKTRWFGGTSSAHRTDITTLAQGIQNAGLKMEYILFDDCYLSTVEVAYDLKEVTDYLIASTCEIMAFGMPYAEIGQYMFGHVDYERLTDAFLKFYENYTFNGEPYPYGTIAVTKCSELDALASIMQQINSNYTFDASLLKDIQRMDGYSPVCFFDCGDYVAKLCKDEALLTSFEAQLTRAVPPDYRKHTEEFYSAVRGEQRIKINTYSGLTISDPSTHPWTALKEETAWYKATH